MRYALHGKCLRGVEDFPLLESSALLVCLETYNNGFETTQRCSIMERVFSLPDLPAELVIEVSSFLCRADQSRLSRTSQRLYSTLVSEVWRHLQISIKECLEEEQQSLAMARRVNGRLYSLLQVTFNSPRPLMPCIQQLTIYLESKESLLMMPTTPVGRPRSKKSSSTDIYTYVGFIMELLPNLSVLNIVAYPFSLVEGWSQARIINDFQQTQNRGRREYQGQDFLNPFQQHWEVPSAETKAMPPKTSVLSQVNIYFEERSFVQDGLLHDVVRSHVISEAPIIREILLAQGLDPERHSALEYLKFFVCSKLCHAYRFKRSSGIAAKGCWEGKLRLNMSV